MNRPNPFAAACIAALPLALFASSVSAQTSWWAPSLSVGVVYDDNTTASSSAADDVILRVTPALEGGWRGPRGSLTALHTFDLERYKEHTSFNDAQIRRRTAIDGDYRLTERLDLSASASTAATDAPGDLIPELGLELGRVDAQRHAADAQVGYRLSERASATMTAGWTQDDVDAGTRITTLLGAIGGEYVASERHTWTADYVNRRYEFDDQEPIDAHIGLIGWTTALSERATLTLKAGPRYSDGETSPEVFVGTSWEMPTSSMALNFSRTQSTVIGQSGLADSQTLWLTYRNQFSNAWSVLVTPGWSRLERGDREAEVVRALFEVGYLVNRNLSLRGSYQFSRQDGRLESPFPLKINQNVVYVGVTWDFIPQPATDESTNRRRR